jgi:hypothetical protein
MPAGCIGLVVSEKPIERDKYQMLFAKLIKILENKLKANQIWFLLHRNAVIYCLSV